MNIVMKFDCLNCDKHDVCKYKNNENIVIEPLMDIKTAYDIKSENNIEHLEISINCNHYNEIKPNIKNCGVGDINVKRTYL